MNMKQVGIPFKVHSPLRAEGFIFSCEGRLMRLKCAKHIGGDWKMLPTIKTKLISIDEDISNLRIDYGFVNVQFGRIVIGSMQRKENQEHAICFLYFVTTLNDDDTIIKARQHWPGANLVENESLARMWATKIFTQVDTKEINVISVAVRGTQFEQQVWNALVAIDFGKTLTYGQIAEMIGRPKAVRAAANAVARNEVSLIIPCHRVVSKNGAIKYHWGAELKKRLLEYEANAAFDATRF